MHQSHFDQSLPVLASSTGRRGAVRSLGAIGTALLAALGFADPSVAAKPHTNGGNGGGANHRNRSKEHNRNRNRGNAGKEGTEDIADDQAHGGAIAADGPAGPEGPAEADAARKVQAEKKGKKAGPTGPTGPTGPAPASVTRVGNLRSGAGFKESTASCSPGEHAVGGGFRAEGVNFATVTFLISVPLPSDGEVPTKWIAAIEDGGASKTIQAIAICVPN